MEVGDFWSPQIRAVDLWAAGRLLTVDDNQAFLPSFCLMMRATAEDVRLNRIEACPFPDQSAEGNFRTLRQDDTEFRERFWFMQWGPTVDNLFTYAYLDDEQLTIAFAFWRPTHPIPGDLGKVFATVVPRDEFVSTLLGAVAHLTADSLT